MSTNQNEQTPPPAELVKQADFTPFFNYLQSQPGHEVVNRLLSLVEDVKRSTLEKSTAHAMFGMGFQAAIVLVVIVATSVLTYLGKFEPSVAVLFGLLVGYIFGRR